jgi:hypothetical protein
MQIHGRIELTTTESTDALSFEAVRENGLLEQLLAYSVAIGGLCFLWEGGSKSGQALAAIGAALLLAGYFRARRQKNTTTLRVTAAELRAEGNLEQMFAQEASFRVDEVTGLGFETGDQGAPSGLYVRTATEAACLLPGLDEEQTNAILTAIEQKFPRLIFIDPTPASLLFGDDSDAITLDLERPSGQDRNHSQIN